jgi:hypothetical protein
MAISHKTARGMGIDMDRLRLSNESTIAIGNMKVNARGDQLGPGGKVIKSRAEIMAERNQLHNSPLADESAILDIAPVDNTDDQPINLQPAADEAPIGESSADPVYVKPRGSFADAVAQQTEVTQELIDPATVLGKKSTGVQRI